MSVKSLAGAFCCAMLLTSSTWATTLEPEAGEVWINHGQGFVRVNGPADAKDGDNVMVGPGGAAAVVYDNGCRVEVQPGAVVSISPVPPSPCPSGSLPDNTNNINWGLVGLGVALAGAAGGIVYFATKSSSSSSPASP
jgi:hypothetical protein